MTLRKKLYRGYTQLRRRLLGIPPPGKVNFGDLRRLEPASRHFGTDRGLPIDRYYIEQFLGRHATDIRGRVLEVGDDVYTRRFGKERVAQADILHVGDGNPRATIVADLADAPQMQNNTFDSIVLTQTLNFIYDARSAVRTLHRIMKPGGVLLLTVPGLTPLPMGSQWGYTWYWSFTQRSVERMLGEEFGAGQVSVAIHGNVLAATAFLQGLATDELTGDELDAIDVDYPVIIAAWARKRD
jgi:SAM-dependent methyltransferase